LKALLEQLLLAAVHKSLGPAAPSLQGATASEITVERTRDAAHGDFASNIALRLAKRLGTSPREVARGIVESMPESPLVLRTEVAANGFINFFLTRAALAREIRRIHALGESYGRSSAGTGKRVTLGVISNPPDLARGTYAAYNEALANVLAAAGYEVEREEVDEPSPRSPQSSGGSESSAPLSRPTIEGLFQQIFLVRSHGTPSRTEENPLYYAQYAHARVASAMKEVRARGIAFDRTTALDHLELLDKPTERTLIAALLRFPEEVEAAAANCAPHSIVYYLREVANAFHTYYNAEQWFVAENDLRSARLALVLAAGQVVRNGLGLIGVPAPESM
jgi:arginyl-tRNA synthetase